MPGDPELAAADPDEDLVFDDHRGVCHRLALLGIAVLDAPDDLTSLGVERHNGGIRLFENNLAIAIRDTPVDRVAAHYRDNRRILLWLVFPQDLPVLVEVEGEDSVRERGIDIHDVPYNERTPLVAPQYSGRERP